MNWKYLKIGGLIFISLLLLIPTILYVNAIDWSEQQRTKVNNLPIYTSDIDSGTFRLVANDLQFLVRVKGMQNTGKAMILLHGFPESSLMWQPLIEEAAAAGYRVIAFDQRGYSPTARPKKKMDYHIDSLVQDVLAVADEVGFDTFHLVGHDWGAGVGWKTVMDYPERIHTWSALSIPHIGVFFKSILEHPEQQKRSAYMDKLRTPLLPELLFHLNQKKFAERLKETWTPEQVADVMAIQREQGATTAALNWYRAMNMEAANESFEKPIQRPTLFIWGTEDPVIAPQIIPLQKDYIKAPYQEVRLEIGHSLMQEDENRVIRSILDFVTK